MTRGEEYSNMGPMDRKTKIWTIILFSVVLLGLLGYFALNELGGGTIAVITVDGVEYDRIDLSKVAESYDIDIDTQYGHNTVHVEPGRISVTEADCPDGVCVAQGAIDKGGVPIVCMPHRLVVKIEGSGIDA